MPQLKRIIFIILALAIAEAAFANGLGGERLEKVVGDLIVDVGTDQPSTPLAGQPIEFDFDFAIACQSRNKRRDRHRA